MCNSVSSTSWIADEKKLREISKRNFHLPPKSENTQVSSKDVLHLFENRSAFSKLEYVAVQGGEPFLEINNFLVLKKFVEWGIANHITVELNTNGTIVNRDYLNLLAKFKAVNFQISIEAVGSLYSYIRGGNGFSIKDLEKNLKVFRENPKFQIIFAVTTSIYSIFHLDELIAWFDKIREEGEEIIMTNTVVRPEYLNFQILPRQLKKQAYSKLINCKVLEDSYLTGSLKFGNPGQQALCEALLNEIYEPEKKMELQLKFAEYTKTLDKLRGSDLLSLVPQLAPLF